MEDHKNIPTPSEVTHEQWSNMTPEERAIAGDVSREQQVSESQEEQENKEEGV